MTQTCPYDVLGVAPTATADDIKRAYRQLVKRYHPDTQNPDSGHDQVARINAAYEVLGDVQRRRQYDAQRDDPFGGGLGNGWGTGFGDDFPSSYHERNRTVHTQYRQRKTGQSTDADLDRWIKLVYQPIDRFLGSLTDSLEGELVELSADPFDDELMERFCEYLDRCGDRLSQARHSLASLPNPSVVAGVAAHLYYSLDRISDGLDELAYFPMNYDETRLHAGQEMFRTADGLHWEAQTALQSLGL